MYEDSPAKPAACVYYDYELVQLRKDFTELYKIFKRIEKRAERRQTVQISKSLFDYYDRKSDLKVCPQKYYDFRYGEYRICLYKFYSKISILCVGFQYPYQFKRDCPYKGCGFLYGEYDTYVSALPLFSEIVYWFCLYFIYDVEPEEIPF